MSHRMAQIESALKRAISIVLAQKLSDPRILGMISVTQVKVSPDLHDAAVYVSVLPQKHQTRTIYGLRHAAVHIHAKVSQQIDIKKVPHLDFRADETIKHQAKINAAIHRGLQRERTQPRKRATQNPQDPTSAGNSPGEASNL